MSSRSHIRLLFTLALLAFAASFVEPAYSSAQVSDRPANGSLEAVSGAASTATSDRSTNAPGIEVLAVDASGTVTVRYTLARAGIVRLSLVAVDGKEVGVLASGLSSAGENKLEIDTRRIAVGEYRCVLQTRDGSVSTRLVVAR